MFFQVILFAWAFVLDVATVSRLTDNAKDLEILLVRQQLRIVERKQDRGPQISRWQKVPLIALVLRLKQKAHQSHKALAESLRLFKPATVLGWHRLSRPGWRSSISPLKRPMRTRSRNGGCEPSAKNVWIG